MVCLLQGLKLQIYRLRRPELLSWVPLIPLQKLPIRFSPGGLEKIPHILGIFFLDILLPLLYIRLILKQVLIIWWKLDEDKAKKLIGGHIYFHKKRSEPSFYGGSIRGYRVKQDEPNQGRIIFEFEYHSACRGVKTDKNGWSIAKKIV